MDRQEQIEKNILKLTDKYLFGTTKNISKDCSTIDIRAALEKRTGEYITKSRLNEILIATSRFNYLREDEQTYYYNIPRRDISLLRESKEVLERLKRGLHDSFKDYTKLKKYKNAIDYKYTFKYLIKLKCSDFYGKLIFSEKFIFEIIARELMTDTSILTDYINFFNLEKTPDIPKNILEKLLDIFNISKAESLTNNNYYR